MTARAIPAGAVEALGRTPDTHAPMRPPNHGSRTLTAEQLRIGLATLRRKLNSYGIRDRRVTRSRVLNGARKDAAGPSRVAR